MASRYNAGDMVGPYRLIRPLGAGGFGEVWLAEKSSALMVRTAAIKLLYDSDLSMVRQEVETWLRASNHRNVLPVWDADIDSSGQVYIASEYMDGGTLTKWLGDQGGKAASLQIAVDMMSEILEGVEYLHSIQPNPIIHRDLKPDNILLQGGKPRITDFGIARVMRTTRSTNSSAGTPSYMAPEVFSGKYSVASDLWAAGVIFHKMLTGGLPFPQTDQNALYGALMRGERVALPSGISREIVSFFNRAFAHDPANRFASAAEMRRAIQQLLSSRSSSRVRPTPPPVSRPPVSPGQSATVVAPHPPQAGGDTRRNFLWAIPLVLGAGAAVFYVATHNSGTSEGTNGTSFGSGSGDTNSKDKGTSSGSSDTKSGSGASSVKKLSEYGIEMVSIPAGSFLMGDSDQSDNPRHTVRLSGYWISKNVITVAQYRAFVEDMKRQGKKIAGQVAAMPPAPEWDWKEDHPVVNVSWNDAVAYCVWLSKKSGLRVKLPTEAQWERAARGTEGRKFPWGNDFDPSFLQHSRKQAGDSGGTARVGSFPSGASPDGVLDMAGNVWQWCRDAYDKDFWKFRPAGEVDPWNNSNNTGSTRVLRGGSWLINDPVLFRSSYRRLSNPASRLNDSGFRVVSEP